jgi:septum formation protein
MTRAAAPSAGAGRLILASASPRRLELLRQAGYDPVVEPSHIDEESFPRDMLPAELALRLAIEKAQVVAPRFPDDVVLAADTVVAFGDQILGKPTDEQHARWMLSLLSGTTHVVVTGVAVIRQSASMQFSARVMSAVRMKSLTKPQIDRYIATNDWQGKAGGYGIQDADPFVMRLSGCHTNIVGLPMTTTRRMLESAGINPKR